MFAVVPRKRKLPYDQMKQMRTGGITGNVAASYAEIAKRFECTESAAYYACNPRARTKRRTPTGTPRSIYADDETWAQLRERSDPPQLSISKVLSMILYGEAPLLVRAAGDVPRQEEVPA